ncbi:MAG: type II toxin-antitoxin system RelE/ParE family toxin [Chloroflexi bacterium]|nr:type II toxin-antitoxin system RelE/ParE family toxin [Chloroflexota bacterium]
MSEILIADEAAEQILKLSERDQSKVANAIDKLAQDPISKSILLRHTERGTDLRVTQAGDHRVLFSVGEDGEPVIVITILSQDNA